jgi:hypothetical protein
MKTVCIASGILLFVLAPLAWPASIEDVTFLTRIQVYETIADTTLITQEGKRVPIDKGTKINVAGFTATEALVVSRSDRPNGFIRREDIAPSVGSNPLEPPRIKEETLPRSDKSTEGNTR